MQNHRTLFKKDSNKNIRAWFIEQNEGSYRTHSGVLDGSIVVSGWQYTEMKNEGKANETSTTEQATSEIESKYTKQLEMGSYYETLELAQENKPNFFKPMLAATYNPIKKPIQFPCFSQPKFDGTRCVTDIDGMSTRNGKPHVSCPHISYQLEEYFAEFPYHIIDGELYNHLLRDDFEKIISLTRKSKPTQADIIDAAKMVNYHVYDMFDPHNPDMCFEERIDQIRQHLPIDASNINLTLTTQVNTQTGLDAVYGEYLEDGYEGQMIRYNTPYENKRSKSLIKRKEFVDEEFEVVEVNEGEGNWAGCAKVIEIKLHDGSKQFATLKGSFELNAQRLIEKDSYVGGEATVRYQNKTSDGKLRFPVVVALYPEGRDS